MNHKPLN